MKVEFKHQSYLSEKEKKSQCTFDAFQGILIFLWSCINIKCFLLLLLLLLFVGFRMSQQQRHTRKVVRQVGTRLSIFLVIWQKSSRFLRLRWKAKLCSKCSRANKMFPMVKKKRRRREDPLQRALRPNPIRSKSYLVHARHF